MVTKVSEITTKDIADFIRLDEVSSSEEIQLSTFLTVAKDYVTNYTALSQSRKLKLFKFAYIYSWYFIN